LRGSPRSPSLKLIEPAKTRMNSIYQKAGVNNRARLVKLVLALAGG
jgi:DNA-binding CsgD family transcriptional regulator